VSARRPAVGQAIGPMVLAECRFKGATEFHQNNLNLKFVINLKYLPLYNEF